MRFDFTENSVRISLGSATKTVVQNRFMPLTPHTQSAAWYLIIRLMGR